MKFIFLDTETTGLLDEDRLIQIAWYCEESGFVNELFKPPLPIKYGAMGVHHITEEDVIQKSSFIGSQTIGKLKELLSDHIIVAHNAEFDVNMLRKEGIVINDFICTKKLARRHINAESNSLQTLRYQLNLDTDKETVAHSAKGDVVVLVKLFNHIDSIVKKEIPDEKQREEYYLKTGKAEILESLPFGKYKNQLFSEVAREHLDYLQWLWDQPGSKDSDLTLTLKHYLFPINKPIG